MKNQELFDKTIGILVNAYLNDTLEHGDCSACAVGNICAGNGIERVRGYIRWEEKDVLSNAMWKALFYTSGKHQERMPLYFTPGSIERNKALAVVAATGYTVNELAKIEYAFETAYKGLTEDEYMFNGLMAVCNTLMKIHKASETEITEAKRLFVKEPA